MALLTDQQVLDLHGRLKSYEEEIEQLTIKLQKEKAAHSLTRQQLDAKWDREKHSPSQPVQPLSNTTQISQPHTTNSISVIIDENARLRKELDDIRRHLAKVVDEMIFAESQIESKNARIADLEVHMAHLQRELDHHRCENKPAYNTSELERQLAEVLDERRRLQEALNDALRREAARKRNDEQMREKLVELKAKAAEERQRHELYSEALEAEAASLQQQLELSQEVLHEVTEDRTRLNHAHSDQQSTVASVQQLIRSSLAYAHQELERLRDERERIGTEMVREKLENEQKTRELYEINQRLSAEQKNARQLAEENRRHVDTIGKLNSLLAETQSALETAQSRAAECDAADRRIEEVNLRCNALEEINERLRSERNAFAERAENLTGICTELQRVLLITTDALKKSKEEFEAAERARPLMIDAEVDATEIISESNVAEEEPAEEHSDYDEEDAAEYGAVSTLLRKANVPRALRAEINEAALQLVDDARRMAEDEIQRMRANMQAADAARAQAERRFETACQERERLNAEIDDLRSEVRLAENTLSENAALREENQKLTNEVEQLLQKVALLSDDYAAAKAAMERLRGEAADAEQLREELRRSRTELQSVHEEYDRRIADLRSEVSQLVSRNAELTADSAALAETKQELERTKQQCAQLRDEAAHVPTLVDEIRRLQSRLKLFSEEAASKTAEVESTQEENKRLNAKCRQLSDRITALSDESAVMHSEVETLNAKLKQTQEAKAEEIRRLTTRIRQLQDDVENAENKCRVATEETERLQTKCRNLIEKVASLESEKKPLEDELRRLATVQRESAHLIENLRHQVTVASATPASTVGSEEAHQLRLAQDELERLRATNRRFTENISELTSQLDDSRRVANRYKILADERLQEVEALKDEISRLHAKLRQQTSEAEALFDSLQDEIGKLRTQPSRPPSRLEPNVSPSSLRRSLSSSPPIKDVPLAESASERFKEILSEKEKRYRALREEADALSAALEDRERQITHLKEELERARFSASIFAEERDRQLARARDELREVTEDRDRLAMKCRTLSDEHERDSAKQRSQLNEAERQITRFREEAERLRAEITEGDVTANRWRTRVEENESTIAMLKSENATIRAAAAETSERLRVVEETLRNTEREKAELVAKLQSENEALRKQLHRTAHEQHTLEEDLKQAVGVACAGVQDALFATTNSVNSGFEHTKDASSVLAAREADLENTILRYKRLLEEKHAECNTLSARLEECERLLSATADALAVVEREHERDRKILEITGERLAASESERERLLAELSLLRELQREHSELIEQLENENEQWKRRAVSDVLASPSTPSGVYLNHTNAIGGMRGYSGSYCNAAPTPLRMSR